MALCQTCNNLRLPFAEDTGVYQHDFLGHLCSGNKIELAASAADCPYCYLLWRSILHFQSRTGEIHSTWDLRRRDGVLQLAYSVKVDSGDHASSLWSRSLDFYASQGESRRDP